MNYKNFSGFKMSFLIRLLHFTEDCHIASSTTFKHNNKIISKIINANPPTDTLSAKVHIQELFWPYYKNTVPKIASVFITLEHLKC